MITYTEHCEDGTQLTTTDHCFRKVRHGLVKRIVYHALRNCTKEVTDYWVGFLTTWLVDTRVAYTYEYSAADGTAPNGRVEWTVDLSKDKAKDLLYLTALRYPEKYPSVAQWLYDQRESFTNDANRFTRFQEWHLNNKIGQFSGENLFDPFNSYTKLGMSEPFALARFQERLLNSHATSVYAHFTDNLAAIPVPVAPVNAPIPAAPPVQVPTTDATLPY